MARRLLQLLALWTTLIGIAQCCPQPCTCLDKYGHQFADCAYKDLLVVPVGLPSNVTTLSLSANKIKLLKSKSFISATQVTSLWLAHNEIVTIETDTLAPLIQLRNLDISYNKIVNFPWEDLRKLTALQLIKMNNNEMINLPKDAFSTLKDLSLEWLRDWITTTKISIPEQNSIVCDTPAHLNGTMVTKMPKLDCKAPTVTITYQPNIENTELYEGFMVILNCETKGSPKPQVIWDVNAGNQKFQFFLPSSGVSNDLPINDETTNNRFLVFQNGTLIIPRISKKEDGNYSCSAINDLGKAESSVKVALAGTQKHASNSMLDSTVDKIPPSVNKPVGPKTSKNNVNNVNWVKPEEKAKGATDSSAKHDDKEQDGGAPQNPAFGSRCGMRDGSEYISNHAFTMTLDDLKQYTFDFGVVALEVSETEAKVQLNLLHLPSSKSNLLLSQIQNLETVNKELFSLIQSSTKNTLNALPDMLYLCVNTGNGHSMVQWSKIEEGVNAYHFHGLQPGTNYTLCLTYGGQDCQVQVVFTTRKKIPSLFIIVVVSTFLLVLATFPLLGATCCHLLYKYQGKTYKLIMKAQNPDQMEKQVAGDFDPRASFVGSEKNFNPSELGEGEGEGEAEEEDGEGEAEGSVVTESIPGSSSKTNQEEFEVGSEYSDRLPLGAEAVNISEEINGNYKQPSH
ncbi:hypothetical protein LDENG_00214990 [Lucifuga dentata]|nr:hypothetical protein LDENG_00214990 [Lucifuga dentata]